VRTVPPGGCCRLCNFLSAWRLAVRVPRQAVWELIAPSGTCPQLGDLAAEISSRWTSWV